MITIGGAILVLLGAWLASTWYHQVPENHCAVPRLLGRRMRKVVYEGPFFCILGPLLKLEPFMTLLQQRAESKVTFNASNDVELAMLASFTFVADMSIPDPQGGWPRYSWTHENPDDFKAHLRAYLEEKVAVIAGQVAADDITDNLATIALYLNCMVRLDGKSLPHLHHHRYRCEVSGCSLPKSIDASDIFQFYRTHWRSAKMVLDSEDSRASQRSDIERLFGIDILKVVLQPPRFSASVQQARDAEEAAKRREKALKLRDRRAQELINRGWPAELAATFVENALDPDVKRSNVRILQGGGEDKSPLIIRLDN